MVKINPHFERLDSTYLFVEISKRCQKKNFNRPLLNLGIGDTVNPLPPSAAAALKSAAKEMGSTVIGYGPSQGYPFLRETISKNDYTSISLDEIFISHGAKTDCAEIHELFHPNTKVALSDPVYPVYLNSSQIYGRDVTLLPCLEENNFHPLPPNDHFDLIYLCSPNNPTGNVLDSNILNQWVQYALEHESILLFDGAYSSFLQDTSLPKSIYEIPGAKKCAIEVRSFSKTAGFTGLRCSYMVIPNELQSNGQQLNLLWKRRLNITTNGVSYPIQKAAEALYTEQGKKELQADIQQYMENAAQLKEALQEKGLTIYGGDNAPYLWCKTPDGLSSWEFFDLLLDDLQIITTPGVGFGPSGEGFVRFSAFLTSQNLKDVKNRINELDQLCVTKSLNNN